MVAHKYYGQFKRTLGETFIHCDLILFNINYVNKKHETRYFFLLNI